MATEVQAEHSGIQIARHNRSQANQNMKSAFAQAVHDDVQGSQVPTAVAVPLYPRLDRNIPGPRANKSGVTPKKTSALTDLRSISPSVVRRKANAALMSAVDSSTPRIKRVGLLKPLNVSILDKENTVTAAPSILLPFTPNANKAAATTGVDQAKPASTAAATSMPAKAAAAAADSPALTKLRSLLKDHADQKAVAKPVAATSKGAQALLELSDKAKNLDKQKSQLLNRMQSRNHDKSAQQAQNVEVAVTTPEQAAIQQSLNSQLKAMLKVIGKKEEQLQKLRTQQVHMQTTMDQLQGDAKEGQALRAADKAAKAYAADLQAKVTKLEKDIEQLRADIIEKDDVLVEAVREKAAGDEDAANDVKRLRGEKKVLQAQLECKTRQLKDASRQLQDMQLDAAGIKRRINELLDNQACMESDTEQLRSQLSSVQADLASQTQVTQAAVASEAAMQTRLTVEEENNNALKAALDMQTQALMEVERNLNEAAAMQSGLTAEEKQQHLAEVEELKTEIASQAASTARLRASLEERSNVIERLTANDVQQQQKINSLKADVFRANNLVDQLHTALEQAKRTGHQGSAELVASLQAELERQAGVIGELRAQLRMSSDAQEELRRQAVSLVEAQAHMAAEQRNVVDGPPIVVAMLHAQLLEKGEIVDQLREVVKAREAAIAQLSNEQVQAGLMFEAVRLERDRLQHEVNTRPMQTTNACQSSSCASSETDSLSRSNSAQSLEHIRRVSGGGSSSSDIDMSDYPILPSTPKPIDRSHSYRSMGSDSNKSIAIAAVHPCNTEAAEPMYSSEASTPQKQVMVGAGAVPAADKASGGGFNKWMVGLVKGSNASKRKEARISQLLKAAAAAGGAVGGGQYCAADAGSHAFCSKAVLRSSPWKSGVYKH